jgi:TonB family protein
MNVQLNSYYRFPHLLICTILLNFFSFESYSFEVSNISLPDSINKSIFVPHDEIVIEQEAEFPGGPRGFGKFLQKKLKYPKKLQRANLNVPNLVVKVQFIVNPDRSVSDFEIIKSVGYGCDEEAIRVLKLTSGKWTPGKQDGRFVRTRFTQPITFIITE